MSDLQAQYEQALQDEAECRLISDLASDQKQRAAFEKLAEFHHLLAAELRKAVSTQRAAQ